MSVASTGENRKFIASLGVLERQRPLTENNQWPAIGDETRPSMILRIRGKSIDTSSQ